jgi:hypothetical protein
VPTCTNNVCSYPCNLPTFRACGAQCIPSALPSCCIAADCPPNLPLCTAQTCVGRALGSACVNSPECTSGSCVAGVCCSGPGVDCWPDVDADGFGDKWAAQPMRFCTCPAGMVSNNLDCHDNNAAVNPNAGFHFSVPGQPVGTYQPDPRDSSPDPWDWNCNDVQDQSLVPPFNIGVGCVVGGQGGCPCATATGPSVSFPPCGGQVMQTQCVAMGCGIPQAPGCGTVSTPTGMFQGCK